MLYIEKLADAQLHRGSEHTKRWFLKLEHVCSFKYWTQMSVASKWLKHSENKIYLILKGFQNSILFFNFFKWRLGIALGKRIWILTFRRSRINFCYLILVGLLDSCAREIFTDNDRCG